MNVFHSTINYQLPLSCDDPNISLTIHLDHNIRLMYHPPSTPLKSYSTFLNKTVNLIRRKLLTECISHILVKYFMATKVVLIQLAPAVTNFQMTYNVEHIFMCISAYLIW